jgi:hypothetical protein
MTPEERRKFAESWAAYNKKIRDAYLASLPMNHILVIRHRRRICAMQLQRCVYLTDPATDIQIELFYRWYRDYEIMEICQW